MTQYFTSLLMSNAGQVSRPASRPNDLAAPPLIIRHRGCEITRSLVRACLRADGSALESGNMLMLTPLLSGPDAEVVAAVAHTLAGRPAAVRQLNPQILEQLGRHPNPLMRHSAAELDESLRSG
jgi:hypothetical protein